MAVQIVKNTDRALVGELIRMNKFVDVIVPRGGVGLTERIAKDATIPVIKHLDGICHVYIDDEADIEKAYDIALNSKVQRYAVCNAMETLLVSERIAAELCLSCQKPLLITEWSCEVAKRRNRCLALTSLMRQRRLV